MPFHRERYPADWESISKAKREDGKCEWCGAPNGVEIVRLGFGQGSKLWRLMDDKCLSCGLYISHGGIVAFTEEVKP